MYQTLTRSSALIGRYALISRPDSTVGGKLTNHSYHFQLLPGYFPGTRAPRFDGNPCLNWLNPFVLSYVYIRTKSQNRCDSCTYIYVHGLRDRNMGLYRRLTDTLRYHPTRCSRDFGLLLAAILFTNGRKVEFSRSCPLFLASFGKLRLSDQVQIIAWHGIQRQIIWIFCRESEVSG